MSAPKYAVVIAIGEKPRVQLVTGLPHLQELVGGFIEGIPNHIGATVYANEDGTRLGLKPNMVASLVVGTPLVGDVVIAGLPDRNGNDTDVDQDVSALVFQCAAEVMT